MYLANLHRIHIDVVCKPAILAFNDHIIRTHLPLPHSPVRGKRPHFEPITPYPHSHFRIVPFVPELHSDPVVLEGKELFPQPILLFFGEFLRQKSDNVGVASKEGRPVAPNGVFGV